ncbi:MAG: metallophosphoesterase [Candidatus Bathyarchaeia archaeon]
MAAALKPVSPYPALTIISEGEKALVISDLHLGWEASLSEKGIHIPTQTNRLLRRLERILALERPDYLIILGDIKHTIEKIEAEEWRDIPEFFERILDKVGHIKVVPGNHDGNIEALLPSRVEVAPQHGIIFGGVGLFHGHTWPDVRMIGCETLVIGHIHPAIVFKDPAGFHITSQIWVKAPCDEFALIRAVLKRYRVKLKAGDSPEEIFKKNFAVEPRVKSLVVMPPFNDVLGGRAINRASTIKDAIFKGFIGPVLRSGGVMLDRAEIYLLDGTFIGTLDKIIALSEH